MTRSALERQLGALLDLDSLATNLAPELLSEMLTTITPDAVRQRLEQRREQPWNQAVVSRPLREALQTHGATGKLEVALLNAIYERMAGLGLEGRR